MPPHPPPETLSEKDAAHIAWLNVLETYRFCQLTVASDRLVAISGIAKYMKPIVKDQYVVGLWKRSLASDVLWRRNKNSQLDGEDPRPNHSLRPDPPQAPSFIWAAVNCVVQPEFPYEEGVQVSVEYVQLHLKDATCGQPARIDQSDILVVTDDVCEYLPSRNHHLLVTGKLPEMQTPDPNSSRKPKTVAASALRRMGSLYPNAHRAKRIRSEFAKR